jgi:putative transposase
MILVWVDEARAAGARLNACCREVGLDARTLQRWRAQNVGEDRRHGPKRAPANKLSAAERQRVLEVANSPAYRDKSPKQIVPNLADLGSYVASESTFYRVLREEEQLAHRGRAKPPVSRAVEEHRATGPNEVLSWDITYLRSPVLGMFFYLYLFIDVWSRKIVGWRVEREESSEVASELLDELCATDGLDPTSLVVHQDNGAPMKGATFKATMDRLGITASFSRPRVSDDNPFSEALYRTMKYRPCYPTKPFESLEQARLWVERFVAWYNHEHLHSAIGFVTPAARHDGRDGAILVRRRHVYERARSKNPQRWAGNVRPWDTPSEVVLNPMKESQIEKTRHAA